ncbi:MAG: NlpC/P60 family protein [Streptosporangiales bacterium]|nr:NlpC/P60 family protein [Streptosporangiales bacterium]
MPRCRTPHSRTGPPAGRWYRRVLVPLAVTALVAGLDLAPAAADPDTPSAREVNESKQKARERAKDVGRIQARLASADEQLRQLHARVEILVERYNGERVKLQRAQEAYRAAQRRLTEAGHEVAKTREEIGQLAAERYRTGGELTEMSELVAGPGGMEGFVERMGTVHALSHQRTAVLDRMRSARIVASVLERQAHDAMVAQRRATERVAEAKRAAEEAVQEQQGEIERIDKEKSRLVAALAEARETATKLEKAREKALAEARAEAAREQAKQSASDLTYGSGGASAGKGAVAANAALRWLGTPYSWGGGTASGPSYGIAHGANIHGFDCSGLTLYAWAQAGVYLDHWTGTQWTSGPHVPLNRLRRGDLVFFGSITSNPGDIHHVGLYIGGGRMVEAPYTGSVVRISSIWRSDLVGATRPG